MRIGGLSSGLDIDSIVRDLMKVERMPLDKVYQDKVLAEWKRDEYRSVNSKLLTLRNKTFDMQLQSTYLARRATSSNESAVFAVATGNSQVGSYEIQPVSLASSATVISPGLADGVDIESNFSEFMAATFPEGAPDEYVIQMRAASNRDFVKITINRGDTLDDVLEKINTNADLGINVFYDRDSSGKVVFTTEGTGEFAAVEFGTDANSTNFQKEMFRKISDGVYASWDTSQNQGSNAVVIINGLTTERETNTFDLNGTTISLKAESTTPVRVEVEYDVDKVFENIKAFVDLYNETIGEINGVLQEPRYRDYPPLTQEQRDAMSDNEIELWEERAKSGMLRNDSLVSGILSDMRRALSSTVKDPDGVTHSLSEIGITTGLWQERGKLHIDETKLKEALRENPEQAMMIFTNNPGDSGTESQVGLARRLYQSIDAGIDRIGAKAGYSSSLYDQSFMGNEIRRYEDQMREMEDRLARTEERLWREFTAMEKALNALYAQSDWLNQQLLGLGT